MKIFPWLWILFYLFDCFLLITCLSQTCKQQKLDPSYLCKVPRDNKVKSGHMIRSASVPPTLDWPFAVTLLFEIICCCAVCVSDLYDEHLTCYWKEVIFPKNILSEGSICFNFRFQKAKIIAVVESKRQKKLFLSQLHQIHPFQQSW